jgi:7-keto-8-aminopelargonate synthetase-like enzyme
LRNDNDIFLVDFGCHCSIVDAVHYIGKPVLYFESRCANNLKEKIESIGNPNNRPLVISDGVFSADGALPPVSAYRDILNSRGGGGVLLYDAHGFGVIGPSGRGVLDHSGLWSGQVNSSHAGDDAQAGLYTCGTLSKAIGDSGVSSRAARNLLMISKARPAFSGRPVRHLRRWQRPVLNHWKLYCASHSV